MDFLSVAVGFITGAFTGAAGNYLADKYTDGRREKRSAQQEARRWAEVEAKFPAVIAEMREDFSQPANRGVRAFFLKSSKTYIGFVSEPAFEYHTDKHPDARAAALLLESHGYVTDISPGDTPMYRVHESLVSLLLGTSSPARGDEGSNRPGKPHREA